MIYYRFQNYPNNATLYLDIIRKVVTCNTCIGYLGILPYIIRSPVSVRFSFWHLIQIG